MIWQKWARLAVAVVGVAFAIVVALGFRHGAPLTGGHVSTSDPKAVLESSEGTHSRHSQSHDDVDPSRTGSPSSWKVAAPSAVLHCCASELGTLGMVPMSAYIA